jgi:hypothetical protein
MLVDSALAYAARRMAAFPLHHPIERGGRLQCSCGLPGCGKSAAKHPYPRLAPKGLNSETNRKAVCDPIFKHLQTGM